MRTEVSRHILSLRAGIKHLYAPVLRENLDIVQLHNILKHTDESASCEDSSADELSSVKAGKKRARNSTVAKGKAKKRVKMLSSSTASQDRPADDDDEDAKQEIPMVYSHVFELGFTTADEEVVETADTEGTNAGTTQTELWATEEEALIESLVEICDGSTVPVTIDLGLVCLRVVGGEVLAFTKGHTAPGLVTYKKNRDVLLSSKRLLKVPAILDNTFDDNDFHPSLANVLVSLVRLHNAGRVKLMTRLKLVYVGALSLEDTELPFVLHLEFHASLIVPDIFAPIRECRDDTGEAQRRFLSFLFSSSITQSTPVGYKGDTNIAFFYSVLGPATELPSRLAEDSIQPEMLVPSLLPFQRRSVGWILDREGKTVDSFGNVTTKSSTSMDSPLFWHEVPSPSIPNESLYYNSLTGSLLPLRPDIPDFAGGIIGEEMGLGKTLECIAVILLNTLEDRNPANVRWDPVAEISVNEVKTTLIITPLTLAQQWRDEISLHAPSLRVLVYEGWQKHEKVMARSNKLRAKGKGKNVTKLNKGNLKRRAMSEDDMSVDEDQEESDREVEWAAFVHNYDVVITTYNILQGDLGVARAPVKRPRRVGSNYSNSEGRRSPLISVEWGRIFMDEVQLVGGGKAAEMVSLIPRRFSHAVSGTPARANVGDLFHALKFVRVQSVLPTQRHWIRLLKPGFAAHFAKLFQHLTVRNLKSDVKQELTIPQQRQMLVPIALGKVERHVYDELLETALIALGADGGGLGELAGLDINVQLLRTWLRRLRGICTHPQVGQLQKGDRVVGGSLRTIGEVLQAMIDQTWRGLMDEKKGKALVNTRHAQLISQNATDAKSFKSALDILFAAQADANELVEDVKTALTSHAELGRRMKEEYAAQKISHFDLSDAGPSQSASKGKERQHSVPSEDINEDDLPQTPAAEDFRTRQRALHSRLREALVAQHKVTFLLGDVHHMLGASHIAAEEAAYTAADELRKTLLRTTEQGAIEAMSRLRRVVMDKGKTTKVTLDVAMIEHCGKGGIRSADLLDEGNEIIDYLNDQADLLFRWRERLYNLLTEKLSNRDQEADGEEYNRALNTQGEAEMYLREFAALLADRREGLTAERNALAAHDDRTAHVRKTRAAMKAGLANLPPAFLHDIPDPDEGIQFLDVQPEHEVLGAELIHERKALREDRSPRALKSIMVLLNTVAGRTNDRAEESQIAKTESLRIREVIKMQEDLADRLEAELGPFRRAFNERILYFRQLQELSDSVAPVDWDGDVDPAIADCVAQARDLENQINAKRARLRYLEHMSKTQDEDHSDDQDRSCILCNDSFTHGYLTQCAHVFCETCINAWLKRGKKACPVCRILIKEDTMQQIIFRDDIQQANPPDVPPPARKDVDYHIIDTQLLRDINLTKIHGSYGTKIETLVRHLLLLEDTDPGAKSIVFSAWADSLFIIEHALVANGIQCLRADTSGKANHNAARKFRTNPDLSVFLLHGEKENAGLNVTCAKRVFLVEPVVNHAFEVQAISRIDRMGQTQNTEVYCYFAQDTVEENILNLGVSQGLSLYAKDRPPTSLDNTLLMTTHIEVDSPLRKGSQKGDFVAKADDMLAILFPHLFQQPNPIPREQHLDREIRRDVLARAAERRQGGVGDAFTGNAVAGPSTF